MWLLFVWQRTFNIVSWLCKKWTLLYLQLQSLKPKHSLELSRFSHLYPSSPPWQHQLTAKVSPWMSPLFSFSKYSNRAVQVGHVPAMLLNSHFSKPAQGADWFCLWCLISAQCTWLCSHSSLYVKCSLQLDLCLRLVGMLMCPGLWSHNAVLVYWVWTEHSLGKSWGKYRGSHFNTMTGKQVLS